MRITGITFVGTRTDTRPAMAAFLRDVLGLSPAAPAAGMDADVFDLPDGSSFAVAPGVPPDDDDRTVGSPSRASTRHAPRSRRRGVARRRDLGQRAVPLPPLPAPDGQLYELVEERYEGTPALASLTARRRNPGATPGRIGGLVGWRRTYAERAQ
jgi:glyoxylase I family protein